jgi:hypothetical protein
VELDYMPDSSSFYDIALSSSQIASVKARYNTIGILLHVDQGAMGGGNQIAFKSSWTSLDWERHYNNDAGYTGFTPARRGIYNYGLMVDSQGDGCDLNPNSPSNVGLATRGDTFAVFRECNWQYALALSFDESASTVRTWVHELGHNVFGIIEPSSDRYSPTDTGHDNDASRIMWPKMNVATQFMWNRWHCYDYTDNLCDIDDLGKGLDHSGTRKYFAQGDLLPPLITDSLGNVFPHYV